VPAYSADIARGLFESSDGHGCNGLART
jgi:hypothetical protein